MSKWPSGGGRSCSHPRNSTICSYANLAMEYLWGGGRGGQLKETGGCGKCQPQIVPDNLDSNFQFEGKFSRSNAYVT
jgi:hypothetical protein